MKQSDVILLLTLVAALSPLAGVQAAKSKKHHRTASHRHYSSSRRLSGAPVYLGKSTVMTLYGTSSAQAKTKAKAVQDRLDQVVKWDIPASKLTVKKTSGVLSLTWGGHPIATVDGLQAEGNRSRLWSLSNVWVSNIQHALQKQSFAISEHSVLLGVGTSHTLKLNGGLSGATTAAVTGNAVTATVDGKGNEIALQAVSAGSGTVVVTRGHHHIPVKVTVKALAGQMPSDIECIVTGAATPKDVLNEALMYALKGNIKLSPGAAIYMKGDPRLPEALTSGKTAVVTVPLSLEGPEFMPVRKSVKVTLHNQNVPFEDAALLMVSSRPDNIDGNGVLFTGKFGPGRPARLFYTHRNGASKPRQLSVTLTNRSDKPAQVYMLAVPAAQDTSDATSSQVAVSRFLSRMTDNAGVVLTIPPRTGWEVMQQTLPGQSRITGICHFQCLNGEDIEVGVQARESGVPLAVASRTVLHDDVEADHSHPKGVFASPTIPLTLEYQAGKPDGVLELAKAPFLLDTTSGESDTNNYGALYKISTKLSNPDDKPHQLTVSLAGGESSMRTAMLIDGKLKESGLLSPGMEELMSSVDLGPKESRTVEFTFMPRPGGSYPLKLIARTRP